MNAFAPFKKKVHVLLYVFYNTYSSTGRLKIWHGPGVRTTGFRYPEYEVRTTDDRPKLPCKLSKLALPKNNFIVYIPRSDYCFFFGFFSSSSFLFTLYTYIYISLSPCPLPNGPFPRTTLSAGAPATGPHNVARAHAHTHNILVIRDDRTPEWRCDGMFEFRYAAFQCENFSLSHSAAFAAVENGTDVARRFCRAALPPHCGVLHFLSITIYHHIIIFITILLVRVRRSTRNPCKNDDKVVLKKPNIVLY